MLRSGLFCAQVPHFNLYNPALPPRATLRRCVASPPPLVHHAHNIAYDLSGAKVRCGSAVKVDLIHSLSSQVIGLYF